MNAETLNRIFSIIELFFNKAMRNLVELKITEAKYGQSVDGALKIACNDIEDFIKEAILKSEDLNGTAK